MKGKVLNILINPHPKLRKISANFDISLLNHQKTKQFLADMKETMLKKDGAGLAAPQVGVNQRIIVLNYEGKTIYMINPEITKLSFSQELKDEGCLSVLNSQGEIYYKPVKRHKWLNCKYVDEKGKIKKLKAKDNLARAILHEIDHLNGVLFIDYLN
jgi:peptide deformylase